MRFLLPLRLLRRACISEINNSLVEFLTWGFCFSRATHFGSPNRIVTIKIALQALQYSFDSLLLSDQHYHGDYESQHPSFHPPSHLP